MGRKAQPQEVRHADAGVEEVVKVRDAGDAEVWDAAFEVRDAGDAEVWDASVEVRDAVGGSSRTRGSTRGSARIGARTCTSAS